MRRRILTAGLCGCWLGVCGFAPATEPPRLPLDLSGLLGEEGNWPASAAQIIDPDGAAQRSMRSGSYLTVDLSTAWDSNYTNQTSLPAIDVIVGDETIPIELDPTYRQRSGLGQAATVSGGIHLPIDPDVALIIEGEAQLANFPGAVGDDISVLLAAGPQVTFTPSSQGALQGFGFERWYGGVIASRGVGLRGRYQQAVSDDSRVYLWIDARVFESGYGEEFDGTQASIFLTYEDLLNPSLSLTLSGYARREALGADAFSNLDTGVSGGLSAFLPLGLKGGFNVGLSRIWFDDPLVFYSADPRRDWRYSGSVWLMPKKAIGPGLWPSLSYAYSRQDSTLQFYRTDRHRVRLGVARYW
jgi:hypothetical protein